MKKEIIVFLVVLMGVSYLLQAYILTHGGIESNAFNTIAPIIMYLPALSTVVFLLLTKQGLKSIRWRLGKPIYLLWAALIPSLLAFAAMLIISQLGWGKIQHFEWQEGQIEILKGSFILGKGMQSLPLFILNYVVTTLLFSLVSGALAFGEELGWRGFLQKHFVSGKGVLLGIILLGLIWGFWHFPLIINGYNYPENPVLGAFILFPLTTVFASFFLAWLTIRANSFWPAVIAHGSVNAFIGSFVSGMDYSNRLYADWLMLFLWFITAVASYHSIIKHKSSMTISDPVLDSKMN